MPIEICKTDAQKAVRYLNDAAAFYDRHAVSTKDRDRIRLMNLLKKKINDKIKQQ